MPADPPPPAPSLRRIVLPAEHGGWAFLGEPILLGLAIAPSPAGLMVALAVFAGFLARQPLKWWLGDVRRGRHYPRTALARRAFAVLAVAAAGALAAAVLLARGPVLFAVALATPLAATALAFDLSLRGREAAAELVAPLALAAVAPAIALAAGWDRPAAFGLWGVLAARVVPSIVYVRARLRLDRGEPAGIVTALALHVAGVGAVALLAAAGLAPWLSVGAMAVLLARAAWQLSPGRPRLSIPMFGVTEVLSGLLVVLATALGAHASR